MDYSEVEEIFCLTADRKFKYFLNKVSETEQVYGLKDNKGWITMKDEGNNIAMPLWPAYEFAKYCLENQWKEAKIESIDLFEFMEYWLDGMRRDGCRVLVFADSSGMGFSIEADKFKRELEEFLAKQMQLLIVRMQIYKYANIYISSKKTKDK